MKKGDKVNVFFINSSPLFNVTVLYIPSGPSDAFVLEDENKKEYIVQLFEKIEVVKTC